MYLNRLDKYYTGIFYFLSYNIDNKYLDKSQHGVLYTSIILIIRAKFENL